MMARFPAMVQDLGVMASGLYEGVGQARQAFEGPALVDPSCKVDYGLRVYVDVDGGDPVRVTEDATEGSRLIGAIFAWSSPRPASLRASWTTLSNAFSLAVTSASQ